MKTNQTTVIVDGKEIDLKNWLTTIEKNQYNKRVTKIETLDYSNVGLNILALLSVCKQAIEGPEYNLQIASGLDFGRVLGIAMDLVPLSEFELLDKFMPAIYEATE